ncbi:aldehyde ferredoxin oxidoreductase C-terminal domain-containing protein [Chloroflexota bacterium]
MQLKRIVNDFLVLCQFIPCTYEQLAGITSAVTSWDTSIMEQLRVAERVFIMVRLFNIRKDFTTADDTLPARFSQPKIDGISGWQILGSRKTGEG